MSRQRPFSAPRSHKSKNINKRKKSEKNSATRKTRTRGEIKEIKEKRAKRRKAWEALREKQLAQGLELATNPSQSNRTSSHETVEEERAEREAVAAAFLDAVRPQLPGLIQELAKIKDFRNPKKVKHQQTLVLFYGVLCFVLHMSSRREANAKLTGPALRDLLQKMFPDLEKLPHQDTLNRILASIDVECLQQAHLNMIRRLVRNKKFKRFLVDGCYPVAIDGTQKTVRSDMPSPEWLERRKNADTDEEYTQYYVYVLEAQLAFPNGLTLPLMSEFLNYEEGDTSNNKQDCETKAFHRLAARLKEAFPRLPFMLLLDGLYANGPVFKCCRDNNWQFMVVLKDESLPSVWEEVKGLRGLEPDQQARRTWGNRWQYFRWVNNIEYRYGPNGRNKQVVHVVVCEEQWEEIDKDGETVTRTSRHAWLSSKALTKQNLHERCNLAARHRWGIEEAILVEKHHGYHYEHLFSYDWNAMKGYHYLMHTGHALNVLARYSEQLYEVVTKKGVRPFIEYLRESLVASWIDPDRLYDRQSPSPQLRLC